MNSRRLFLRAALSFTTACLAFAGTAQAQQTWKAYLGAQNKDLGHQAIAFLPNELWIHVGDSVTWSSASGDIHTVTFLVAGQAFQSFSTGCPGYSPSGVAFNGSTCVSAPPLNQGQSFTVKFTAPGNFKLTCLVHPHMTGVVHVLSANTELPHDQAFYDAQAAAQAHALLADTDSSHDHDMTQMMSFRVVSGKGTVIAGVGEMTANPGGFQALSVMRFLAEKVEIHAGDTVEWKVMDPATPHTITFGVEPGNPGPPSSNVHFDADGARSATITYVGESVHSGIIGAPPEDQVGVPQAAPTEPVFRVKFTNPGTYDYKCALHDTLGMLGKVVVLP